MNRYCVATASAIFALAFIPLQVRSAETTNEPLATVQKNVEDKKAVIVDVREQAEWDKGHVEGAIFLPLSELRQGVDATALAKRVPKDKIIYTHCVVGKRSLTAANILEGLGYTVRSLKPGYKEMVAAGFKSAEASATK